MNSFYKYLIFFIIGIILSLIIFKKNLVEGLPIICGLTQESTGRPDECEDNDDDISKTGNMIILNNTWCTTGETWDGRDDWNIDDWSKYGFPVSGTASARNNFQDCRYRCNGDNTCAAVTYR